MAGIMENQISKSQFKAKALEIFRQVESNGQPVVITDRGQARLEIRSFKSRAQNPLDVLRGSVLRFEAPTAPVAEDDWEALR
jgi:antitoxin (DNA-binding transcriptional repressor) of toxin-antitoxin stability system